MAEIFGAVRQLREGGTISQATKQRARDLCAGGKKIRNLNELHSWMNEQFPDVPFFDATIGEGEYPKSLAAFLVSCDWLEWKKHAIWTLHGDLYIKRLQTTKDGMPEDMFRDHLAGALMHRANGLTHMARCGKSMGQDQFELPCWDTPRTVLDIAANAVHDIRQACTLRSAKYGAKGNSKSILFAYKAALQNLATAITVHGNIAGEEPKMASWLEKRANSLSLCTNTALLEACESGTALAPAEQIAVQRDLRLAETAAANVFPAQVSGTVDVDCCLQCKTAAATMIGFSCRCRCLCQTCASGNAQRSRIQECPRCGDYTEFVQDAAVAQSLARVPPDTGAREIKFQNMPGEVLETAMWERNSTVGAMKITLKQRQGRHITKLLQGGRELRDVDTVQSLQLPTTGAVFTVIFGEEPQAAPIQRSNSVVSLYYKDGPGD